MYIVVLYRTIDLKHLIETERAESRARGYLHSSTSESYYTDSYLDGSKDETSSHGMKIWSIAILV